MLHPQLLYQIALTLVPNVGCVRAKLLLAQYNYDVESIFKAKAKDLAAIEGVGEMVAKSIKKFDDYATAENEMSYIEKHGITPLFINDTTYPKRLLNAYDSPTMLYYKGQANLNHSKIIAIVGTRSNTEYGKKCTDQLIADLAPLQPLILSGLAYGIDVIAHKAAIKYKLPTVGVLAHGLHKIYPPDHTKLAYDMVDGTGGILTEYRHDAAPDRHNFPTRNRIVAAMADATIVIETDVKGGSMITAELANAYNKEVYALPGKCTDAKSAGCNQLIKHKKAQLITQASDIIESMGWHSTKVKPKQQRSLFIDLTPNEHTIINILQQVDSIHIDELQHTSQLTSGAVASALLTLELNAVIATLPGKVIKLL